VFDLVSFFVTDGVISGGTVDSRDDGASESVGYIDEQCQRCVSLVAKVLFVPFNSLDRNQKWKVDGFCFPGHKDAE